MSKVALNLRALSDEQQVAKGRKAVTACTGSAVLGTPAPEELAALNTATTAFETASADAIRKRDLAQAATVALETARAGFTAAYGALGNVVENKTSGDAEQIRQLGYDVAGKPGATVVMTQPQNATATMGDLAGTVDFAWDPVPARKSYIAQFCADPMSDANWRQFAVCSKSSITVTGLTSGQRYWFRVCAVGGGDSNQGPWSDPAQKMAP